MKTDGESEEIQDRLFPDMPLGMKARLDRDTLCSLQLVTLAAGCFGSIPASIQMQLLMSAAEGFPEVGALFNKVVPYCTMNIINGPFPAR